MRSTFGPTEQAPLPTPHSPLSTPRRQRRRGSVLVAVLAIILLLSFLIVRIMQEAMKDLEYRAIFSEPPEVRSFAYSMLEVALATVQEVALIDDGKLYAGEQGWNDPIAYAGIQIPSGWEVDISIEDLGGKIPLNSVNENGDLLVQLLEEQLEFDFGTTRELVSVLQDWIDENDNQMLNGAESEEYLRGNPEYKAANAPLQSLDELRLLRVWQDEFFDEDGQPNELFHKLSNLVSVENTGAVNLNAAPQEVLDALAESSGSQSDYLFDGLDEPYLKAVPGSFESDQAGVEIGLLRVSVRLKRGEVPFSLAALVEPDFGEGEGGSGSTGGSAPGSSSDDAPKTGAISEQDAIQFPFKILQINEYQMAAPPVEAARYSAVDIGE
ncbi:MAG: general secretion pathway protein GspK [Coraliomargarita sp.]